MKFNIKVRPLIGSILGDIAGSRFEWGLPKELDSKTVELFGENCHFTDDTILSIATKHVIDSYPTMTFEKAYAEFGEKYPGAGFGGLFEEWIYTEDKKPYNSYGNGSAMRAGYIGSAYESLGEVRQIATESAICTHNHPEGVKGAVATAESVWMATHSYTKDQIRDYIIREFGYDLSKTLNEIRPTSQFEISCQGTMPQALLCFLESVDYESCIRNVFSIQCDVDTVACIAGGIAAAFYGKTGFDNEELLKTYLDDFLLGIVQS